MQHNNWQKRMRFLKAAYMRRVAPCNFELAGGMSGDFGECSDSSSDELANTIMEFLTITGNYANRLGSCAQILGEGRQNLAVCLEVQINGEGFTVHTITDFDDESFSESGKDVSVKGFSEFLTWFENRFGKNALAMAWRYNDIKE